MGKYDQYIITTSRPLELTHYRLQPDVRRSTVWMDSSLVDGACNMECVWYYKPFDGPPHHVEEDSDEILNSVYKSYAKMSSQMTMHLT